MDSMRSLNTSLPRTTPGRRNDASKRRQPSGDLLSSFKAAALSITTLYKVAAAEQVQAKAAGYQDALEDLLSFMERDKIGFTDGEGSRIRQWAIERLDGSQATRAETDEEDEDAGDDERVRAQSPDDTVRSQQMEEILRSGESTPRPASDPSIGTTAVHPNRGETPTSAFSFRSSHQYPTNHEREPSMDSSSVTSEQSVPARPSNNPAMRIDIVPKTSRNRNNRNSNNNLRSSAGNRPITGSGAGSKRRFPLGDFFDISGLSFDAKDPSSDRSGGGGKRARHS